MTIQPAAELAIDHVLIAVPDLDRANRAFEERFGLTSVEGGRHPDWGTANRIVPAGAAYLELVAVVDPRRASNNTFGRWVASAGSDLIRPLGWAVRTDVIHEVATRLDLRVETGSRAAPDGHRLDWRVAGVDDAALDPALPFFIEWGGDTPHPSGVTVSGSTDPIDRVHLELRGDEQRLRHWLGEHRLPVRVDAGTPEVARVVLTTSTGREVVIDAMPA